MSFTESEINPGFPTERDATTASVRGNFAIAQREISAINEVIATALTGAPYLPLAGGELTGRLLLPGGDPGHLRAAVTQGWVQSYVEGESGAGLPEAPTDGEIYGRGNRLWSSVLPLAGGVLTGALTLAGAPTVALHAASKAYADSLPFLPLTGGMLTGGLSFGSALATGPADMTRHISLFGTQFGFAITNNRLNYVATSGSHVFRIGAADMVTIAAFGLLASNIISQGYVSTTELEVYGVAEVPEPVANNHAATKGYVDAALAAVAERVTALEARR